MEERVIDFESRQALRRERRRRQIRRARFLQAVVWVLAIAGLIVLGREMFTMFRRVAPLPDSSTYQGAEPADGGQVEVIRAPLDDETLREVAERRIERGESIEDMLEYLDGDSLKSIMRELLS